MTVVGHQQETMLLRVKYKTYFLICITIVDENYHSTFNYDGVQELKLL